ncbi:MAG: hypothetical protein HDR74_05355 [Bacteroides sp.]|nr:hypothetical protein [Bacteroides sp.]
MLVPTYEYTQKEIDEYGARCLSNFFGVGGNIPFPQFKKEYGMKIGAIPVSPNERYYLAKQPYTLCRKPIIPNYQYPNPQIPFSENETELITGLKLVSLSTRAIIPFDIRHLLRIQKDANGLWHIPNGTINRYIFSLIENAVPYITLREVLQGAVEYIGNRHIYFTEDRFLTPLHPELKRPVNAIILNCHFAEYVNYNNH